MSRRRSSNAPVAVALVGCLLLGACAGSDDKASDQPSSLPPAPAPTTAASAAPSDAVPTVPDLPEVSADLAGDLQVLLDDRAASVLARDRPGFLDTLATDDSLRTTEGGYYDNLAQLPLGAFTYTLQPASLVRSGDAYWGVVQVELQLTPYDVALVRSADRFRFTPAGSGNYRISSTTDEAWEAENLLVQQPWDTEPVLVQEGAGVLGIFDSANGRQAGGIVASVERGISDISARVPYTEWGNRAVVYALSDPRFLKSFDNLPGGDPQALDGVAFTVPTGAADKSVAATRFALSPTLLNGAGRPQADPDLDRLVRHELAHVAIGPHDDEAPIWLSEGIAEWLSVQALAPAERDVPDDALRDARRGVSGMPSDESFNDDDAESHYALAWFVCEWLAQNYGAQAPFTILDHFAARPDDDPAVIIKELLGFSVDQLAKRGADLMVQTYAPTTTPSPTVPVPTTPTTPGSTPTIYE